MCAANIALHAYRHVTYSLQGAPATVSEAQKPASLLLGDFSAHSSITSCRRDVDQLAALLGPLLAPLVGKAVNLASAAYVARTLAQPAHIRVCGRLPGARVHLSSARLDR